MTSPLDMWLIRTVHNLGQLGDATVEAVEREALGHHLTDAQTRVGRLVSTGHLLLVGGHLAVHTAGRAVLVFEDEHHGYERPSRRFVAS